MPVVPGDAWACGGSSPPPSSTIQKQVYTSTMATALTIAAMYLVPLAALTWLYTVRPGYALILVAVLGAILGAGALSTLT